MSSPTITDSVSAERAEALKHGAIPMPTSDTAPFWEATDNQELHIPYCNDCARHFFYPRSHCRYCDSTNVAWRRVSGSGRLLSYVINRKPFPEFKSSSPQVIAIVELDEGVNILSQIATHHSTPEELPLGLPLQVVFVQREGISLPFFIPSTLEETADHA